MFHFLRSFLPTTKFFTIANHSKMGSLFSKTPKINEQFKAFLTKYKETKELDIHSLDDIKKDLKTNIDGKNCKRITTDESAQKQIGVYRQKIINEFEKMEDHIKNGEDMQILNQEKNLLLRHNYNE